MNAQGGEAGAGYTPIADVGARAPSGAIRQHTTDHARLSRGLRCRTRAEHVQPGLGRGRGGLEAAPGSEIRPVPGPWASAHTATGVRPAPWPPRCWGALRARGLGNRHSRQGGVLGAPGDLQASQRGTGKGSHGEHTEAAVLHTAAQGVTQPRPCQGACAGTARRMLQRSVWSYRWRAWRIYS